MGCDVNISPFHEYYTFIYLIVFLLKYICALFFISLPSTLQHVPDICSPVVAHVPDILSGRNCAVLIQIYFTTLNTTLNKNLIIFFYQWTNEGRQKMTIFLLFANYAFWLMWCVLLQWRRKQSEVDKTTQRCLARCLWTVFFFVILKGTVQWIVHIEECLSYICQCSFYIILWSIKVDWWKFITFCASWKFTVNCVYYS